jgi:hypothetical protein
VTIAAPRKRTGVCSCALLVASSTLVGSLVHTDHCTWLGSVENDLTLAARCLCVPAPTEISTSQLFLSNLRGED